MHRFPIFEACQRLSGLSVVALSEVWVSCDTMRDADHWYCSLAVLALNVVSWIFLVSSPVRAVGVTAPFCLHLSIRACAAYTQQSWTSGQIQSAVQVQRLNVFR